MTGLIRPSRRWLITGLASFLAAPAIVRASSLMTISVPARRLSMPVLDFDPATKITQEAIERWLSECLAEHMSYRLFDAPQPTPRSIMQSMKEILS